MGGQLKTSLRRLAISGTGPELMKEKEVLKMGRDLISELALAMWIERELTFPERVRRMKPDDWDEKSGAWDAIVEEAKARKT